MENKESFTLLVKREILEADRTPEETVLFLLGLFKINGTHKSGKIAIRVVDTLNRNTIKKMINKSFNTRCKTIGNEIFINQSCLPDTFKLRIKDIELNTDNEFKIFITGLFFGKGYVSSPKSKYYHLEIRVKELVEAINIVELFSAINIKSNFEQKGKSFRVYIKKADDISDLLAAFNSPTYSMVYINQKIQRDFRATIMRQNAIDITNQERVAEASLRHQKACDILLANLLKYDATVEEIRIAKLRIKHPDYSSSELAFEYSKLYYESKSKSTINRWLNNIIKIIEEKDDE